jgi:phosphatidylinositol-3-phosphatase
MMKNKRNIPLSIFIFALLLLFLQHGRVFSQNALPLPDHVVIAFLENHSYLQIIGSEAAPHINALATDPHSALFTKSYGVEHPSQPNYIDLYSGSNQGVTHDTVPINYPFVTPNLGRQLIDVGLTFTTYSEDLPGVGFDGAISGEYMRKHNAAANWMGIGENQIPATTNQPFSAFPSTDFSSLPTVCFVVPNQVNNMHNGEDPARIIAGDNWIYDNLSNYIEWAKTHNSLFILTWDEDNYAENNHIVTIFTGQMLVAGEYADSINHYNILRTIEDIYGLPYAGNASTAVPITDCWTLSGGINERGVDGNSFSVYPNPAQGAFRIRIESPGAVKPLFVEICNVLGKSVYSEYFNVSLQGEIQLNSISPGVYFVKVGDDGCIKTRMLIVR